MKKVYYNPIHDPSCKYKEADGLQGEIDSAYNRANAINLRENTLDKEYGRDSHVHKP